MGRFMIDYSFRGRSSVTIEAESLESAKAEIDSELESDDFHLDADEIDDVDYTASEMFAVTRSGKEIWTTYIRDGDKRGHASALQSSPLFAATTQVEAG